MIINPFDTLTVDIERHWREFQPTLVADLEARGTLDAEIAEAARRTQDAVETAVAQGTDFWAAWEMYRETWAFVAPEPGWTGLDPDDEGEWQPTLSPEDFFIIADDDDDD